MTAKQAITKYYRNYANKKSAMQGGGQERLGIWG